MDQNAKKQAMIEAVRKRAKEVLKLCDEAQAGRISAEEFEKRISKAMPHWSAQL